MDVVSDLKKNTVPNRRSIWKDLLNVTSLHKDENRQENQLDC